MKEPSTHALFRRACASYALYLRDEAMWQTGLFFGFVMGLMASLPWIGPYIERQWQSVIMWLLRRAKLTETDVEKIIEERERED